MIYKLRKFLCYTIILTLLNASSQSIHAFPDHDEDFKGSSLVPLQRTSDSSLETPQLTAVSKFVWNPLKALSRATKSIIRHSLKPFTLGLILQARGGYAGDQFQVSQNATAMSPYFSSAASLINGSMFVTWPVGQIGNSDIYARVFNETDLGNESIFNQNITGVHQHPSVARLPNDDVFGVWESNQDGDYKIYGRISENTTAFRDEFPVSQNTTVCHHPHVASSVDGYTLVTWSCGISGIFKRIFFPNGTAFENESRANQNTTGIKDFPFGARLIDGNWIIVWQSNQDGKYHIFGRVFSPSGVPLNNEFLVSQDMIGNQYFSSVVPLMNGNMDVVWHGSQTGNYNVFRRVLYPNGTAFGNESMANQNTTGNHYFPFGARLIDGNLIEVWQSNQGGNYKIYGRIFSENDIPLSDDFPIGQNTNSTQQYPFVVSLPNGGIYVQWTEALRGTYSINGRFLDAATLASFLYPIPNPVPLPAPNPAPASILVSAPLPAPNPAPVSLVPSPILSPSSFTQSPSGIGSLGVSSSSTDMFTLPNTPSSTPSVQSSSGTGSLETLSSSIGSPGGTSWKKIAAIAGGAGGGVLLLGTLGLVATKKCCSSENNKSADPDVELAETSVSSSGALSGFSVATTGVREGLSFKGGLSGHEYEIWKKLTRKKAKIVQDLTVMRVPLVPPSGKVKFNLGKGGFGTIYAGKDLETEEIYAIKVVRGEAIKGSLREGEIVHYLGRHPNIMSLIDYMHFNSNFEQTETYAKPRLFQVMPLAFENGIAFKEMLTGLENKQREKIVSDTFQQLMNGLAYIHKQGYVHLDIKGENLLYMKDGILRIADFGKAKKMDKNDQIDKWESFGDKRKFSPEIIAFLRPPGIDGEKVDSISGRAADVWAAGLYIWELLEEDASNLFSCVPISLLEILQRYTYAYFEEVLGKIDSLKEQFSSSLLNLLRQALAVDPAKRIQASKVKKELSSLAMETDERKIIFEELIRRHTEKASNVNASHEEVFSQTYQPAKYDMYLQKENDQPMNGDDYRYQYINLGDLPRGPSIDQYLSYSDMEERMGKK